MILALDCGVRLGWARSDGATGTLDLRPYDDHGEALAMFRYWLGKTMHGCAELAVERGFGGNGASGRLTTALELTAHSMAFGAGIPRTDRSANEVRKWLLGYAAISVKAEPSKAARVRMLDAAVLQAVRNRGFSCESEHAADAAALLICVRDQGARKLAA